MNRQNIEPDNLNTSGPTTAIKRQTSAPSNLMNKNPLNKGMISENFAGIGEVSGEMVAARANELALIVGRAATEADYEQARRELTGGSEMDSQKAMLESIPEYKRWNPVPGSTGQEAQESASEDEDEDGRSKSAQLFEDGIHEAEHDLMLQAARAAQNKDLRDQ